MRIFGTKAFALTKGKNKGKFESRSEECVLLGYASESKAYRLYSPKKRTIITCNDVKFMNVSGFKSEFKEFFDEPEDGINIQLDDHVDEPENSSSSDESVTEEQSQPIRHGRGRPKIQRTGQRGRPRKVYQPTREVVPEIHQNDHEDSESTLEDAFEECEMAFIAATNDPLTIKEAQSSNDAESWTKAMEDEFMAQILNKTWQIVERPSDRKVIGNKMVFQTKDDGSSTGKKKARLVAKGYAQKPGEDFHETYSPVARFTSVRLLAALSAEFDMEIHQMDVVTAYLNGELEEKVFMNIPENFNEFMKKLESGAKIGSNQQRPASEYINAANQWRKALKEMRDPVCLIKRALYGLRQSGLRWYWKLTTKLQEIGLVATEQDPCLFVKRQKGKLLIVTIYVDDLLLASNHPEWLQQTKTHLSQAFKMKDFGAVKTCLGIEFEQNKEKHQVFLSQEKYINAILKRFGMTDCKPALTPIESKSVLRRPDEPNEDEMRKYPYQNLIGSLMFLSVTTRPDIAYAVNFMSQFNSNYSAEHWKASKRILRYLSGTKMNGLLFKQTGDDLYGVVDADWGGNLTDRRSYSGQAFLLAGAAISWEARKQRTVALSSTESEYLAMSEAVKEALYLKALLKRIGTDCGSVRIFNDNQSAQHLVKGFGFHPRTKHIDVRHHFIQQKQKSGEISVQYMQTEQMPADVLTKGLSGSKHNECSLSLGVTYI
ncbi:hypothetical protein ACLKA7_001844 [Drosophila subpalustris]